MSTWEVPTIRIGDIEVKISEDYTEIDITDFDGYVLYTIIIKTKPIEGYNQMEIESVEFQKVKK